MMLFGKILAAMLIGYALGYWHGRTVKRAEAWKLEHYVKLFTWANENCRDCAEGRIPRHPQPLATSETEGEPNGR